MSIIQGSSISASSTESGSADFYDYPIEQSLRFDGNSYLSRNLTATGNRKIWTLSCWIKRAKLSSLQYIFSFGSNGGGNDGIATIGFDPTNSFYAYFDSNTSAPYGAVSTTNLMRDTSSFYHIVWQVDATISSADYWINGQKVQNPGLQPPDYTYGNQTGWDMMIGTQAWAPASPHLSGYMANIQFIDGQALDASYFGEISQDIWVPKTFDGTSSTGESTVSTDYGTNGFLLDFSDISGTTINDTAPIDTNHSSANNWTATGF